MASDRKDLNFSQMINQEEPMPRKYLPPVCLDCDGTGYTTEVHGGPQDGEFTEVAEQVPCFRCEGQG